MKLSVNQRYIGCGIGLLVGIIISKALWQIFSSVDPCDNQILSETKSPNGKLKAVVFERDCGATTDFSTQVSVLPSDAALYHGGNIFVVDSNHGIAP